MSGFDFMGDLQRTFGSAGKYWRIATKAHDLTKATLIRREVEKHYGREIADAVDAAIKAGQDHGPILRQADAAIKAKAERERLLASPPPIHGSASWARASELAKLLKPREAFDDPSSILLGTYEDDLTRQVSFAHWNGDGHLLTIAPTRSGKAVTSIVPNLLRYGGSAVVLDPKGELYAATSKWRAANVGPVFRLAPFDDGSDPATAGYVRHGYNPMKRIRNQADARYLAEMLLPRDAKSPEFFAEDAIAFVTALIRMTLDEAPPERQNLAVVRSMTALPADKFANLAERMARSPLPSVADAANNVLGKSGDRGLPNLKDTLNSKFAMWSDENIQDNVKRHDFDFADLKDRPATVYIDIPFDYMQTYAPWLRVVLRAALDDMLRNKAKPEIPVLFVLDEFLSLGPFPEFRNAIRSHAGAGVRLWFFLQDLGSMEEHYEGASWRPFLNCSVKQFFGINDPYTAELIGKYLGTRTVAYEASNTGSNISAQNSGGWWERGGGTGVTMSSGESIQFAAKPLLAPDEVMALLSGWQGDGWRWSITSTGDSTRPFKVRMVAYEHSKACMERLGAYCLAD